MDNDKAFAAYTLLLFVGVIAVLSAVVTLAGTGTWPSLLHITEHVAMGLSIRFAYKWIGGFNPADWSIASDRVREASAASEMLAPGETAGAMG